MEQLLDDVGKLFWQRLAHLRAGVLAAHVAADGDEAVDGDVVPVVDVFLGCLDEFQLLFRIIDERAELAPLGLADVALEEFAHLAAYVSRCILQHVLEGGTLAVQVGQEMLRTLGEVENGFEVDDFGSCRRYRRERCGEQLQVVHVTV